MNYKEILTKQGWTLQSNCLCGGVLTEKYTNKSYPSLVLIIKPNRRIFQVETSTGVIKTNYLSTLDEFLEKIKELSF